MRGLPRCSWVIVALLAAARPAAGQTRPESLFIDVRQGTDFSVTTAPGLDFMIVELLGRLWRLPVTGGAALPLTPLGETARHPRIRGDGEQVVFQRLSATGWDIWLLDLASERQSQITDSPGNEREPAFMSTGDRIVFAADRAGQYDLWSVAVSGGPWDPVSTEPGDARYPDVADNGAVAYIVSEGDTNALQVRSAGLTTTLYETHDALGPPSWRPGGGVIVFQEHARNAEAKLRMALLAPELLIRNLSSGEDLFSSRLGWLDSTRFLYAADGQVWERRLAGSTRRPVHLFATAILPTPPPPMHALLGDTTSESDEQADSTPASGLAVLAAAGDLWLVRDGMAEQLTAGAWWDEEPLLDPAGNFVIFARNHNGERRLWRLPLAPDTQPEALTPPGQRAFGAALDPTGTRLAWLAGPAAFAISSPAHLNTLYLEDGTRQRSDADNLRSLAPPRWLEDNRTAALSLTTLSSSGIPQNVAFDAGLRRIDEFAGIEPGAAATPADSTVNKGPNSPLPQAPRTPAVRYVIQAGRLFDGIGTGYRRHVDIHIEAGKIVDVVARGRLPLPREVIDASELTVLPGLIDVHTHDLSLLGELAGRAWLAFGVTTVRATEPFSASQSALAAAWNSGLLPGPRLIRAAASIAPPEAGAPVYPPALLDDPFIVPPGEQPQITFTQTLLPPMRATPAAVLPRRYSPAQRHYQDVFSLQAAAGTAEITSLAAFTSGATRAFIVGNPALRRSFERLFPAGDRAAWLAAQPFVDATQARQLALTRFLRAGAQIAIGTEAPHTPPGLGEHIELAMLVAAGVPNDLALRAATSTAALVLGLEQEIGTVEAGRRADLVIVAGDPLESISAATDVTAVVRDGRWIERDELLDAPASPTP